MMRLLAALSLLLVSAAPSTRPDRPEPTANLYLVTPKVWHDADGFSKADIDLGLGVVLVDQSIRAAGYDAWEIDRSRRNVAISDEELRKGKSAFEQFKALAEKHRIYIKPSRKYRAVYGRIEGELFIYTDTTVIDVAKYAREHGWCRDTNEEL